MSATLSTLSAERPGFISLRIALALATSPQTVTMPLTTVVMASVTWAAVECGVSPVQGFV